MGTKQDFSGLKVGDGIWCTQPQLRSSEGPKPLLQLQVTKMARKYMTTIDVDSKWKYDIIFEIATGRERGAGNYPRTLVLSPYQYEADRKRDVVWTKFVRQIQNKWSITDVDEADIRTAAKLLGIELE